MTTRTRTRPTRTIRITEAPDANAPDVWTVRIIEGDEVTLYDVCRGTVGARYAVWLWRKQLASLSATCAQTPYVIDVGNEFGASCTCKGCSRWGHCRHLQASQALTAAGKLPSLACSTCHGQGGPASGDRDSDGCACRTCGE